MGTTAFFVVWLPLGVTLLAAGVVLLRHARAIRGSGTSVSFERVPSSPVAAERTLPSIPLLDAERDAREYRLLGIAMLAGSAASLLVGAVQVL